MRSASQARRWSRLPHRLYKSLLFVLLLIATLVGVGMYTLSTGDARHPNARSAPSQPPPRPPYTVRSKNAPDMPKVKKLSDKDGTVRVEFATVGANTDNTMCTYWVSSLLTGVQTTTAGRDVKGSEWLNPLPFLRQIIAEKQLRDWDVVVYTAMSLTFTGTDMQPYVDDFIRRSPAHPDGIDVRAIRQGTKVAPLRFGTNSICDAPRTLVNNEICENLYLALDQAVESRAAQDSFQYLPEVNVTHGRSNSPYLYAWFIMGRVWALKELQAAHERFSERVPTANDELGQSAFTALYLDLRWGELALGLLAPPAQARIGVAKVNQFGLHYGVMDLWHAKPPFALAHTGGISDMRIDARLYNLSYDSPMLHVKWMLIPAESLIGGILSCVDRPSRYVRQVASAYNSGSNPLPTVAVAPPLLARNPNLIDVNPEGESGASSFPPLVNVPFWMPDFFRHQILQFMGWYIALDLVPGQRNTSAAAVLNANITTLLAATGTSKTVKVNQCLEFVNWVIVNGPHVY